MKSTKVLFLVMSLTVLMAVSAVYAQQGPGMGRGMGRGPVWADLNAEQQKQADALKLDFLKKTEPQRAEMRQKRIELMELMSKDQPDEQAIEKKRQEIWGVQDKLRSERRAMGTTFRALLTPEQRKKLGPIAGMGCGPGGGCGMGGGGCKRWAGGSRGLGAF